MKRSETLSIEQAFQSFMAEEPDFHEQLLQVKTLGLLPSIFGAMWQYVGKHSISEGTLYLQIYSPPVKQGIMLDKAQFLRRINEAIGVELLIDLKFL